MFWFSSPLILPSAIRLVHTNYFLNLHLINLAFSRIRIRSSAPRTKSYNINKLNFQFPIKFFKFTFLISLSFYNFMFFQFSTLFEGLTHVIVIQAPIREKMHHPWFEFKNLWLLSKGVWSHEQFIWILPTNKNLKDILSKYKMYTRKKSHNLKYKHFLMSTMKFLFMAY